MTSQCCLYLAKFKGKPILIVLQLKWKVLPFELTALRELFNNSKAWRWGFKLFFWSDYTGSSIWFCSISQKQSSEEKEAIRDIILRKENPFLAHQHGKDSESEDEAACLLPDLEKDDFAARRVRMNQRKPMVPLNQLLYGPYRKNDEAKAGSSQHLSKGPSDKKNLGYKRCALCVCLYKKEHHYAKMLGTWPPSLSFQPLVL